MTYKIAHHRLLSDFVQHESSEKNSGTFAAGLPDTLVFHFTGTGSLQAAVNELMDEHIKASAHLIIGRNGGVVQLMPFDRIAWHAGVSEYQGRQNINRYSIGIELENAGRLIKSGDQYLSWFGRAYSDDDVVQARLENEDEPGYWHRYTEAQISTVLEISRLLCSHYNIQSLAGHSEITRERQADPGPALPLHMLRQRLLNHDRREGVDSFKPMIRPGTICHGDAFVLSEPSGSSPAVSLDAVCQGTPIDVKGENQGFYRVSIPVEGWISKDCVKLDQDQLHLQQVIDV